jgi:Rrf2 family cysteine metabolism transcriptional repressor
MRIMVYMALHNGNSPVRKQDIARAEGMSEHYVEQILMKLKTAGFVRSIRGKKGGFALDRDPEKTTVYDVLRVTEGPVALVPCFARPCSRIPICTTRNMWKRASDALNKVFSETTVADLAEEARRLKGSKSLMFNI